jgi:AraC-like DNA-binding protein
LYLTVHSRYSSRVTGIGIIALDLGIRGAAAGLFLMIMFVILIRVRPHTTIKLLGAAMAAQTVAYLIATAPFVPKSTLWWTLPLMAGNPVVIWLWVRATFDDDFVIQRWHGALWLIVVGIAFAASLNWTSWPVLARAAAQSISLLTLVLALSAAVQTVRTWRADLVAGRRRMRLTIVTSSLLFVGLLALSHLTSDPAAIPGVFGSLPSAMGLLAMAALVGWSLFYPPPADPVVAATAMDASPDDTGRAQTGPRADGGRDAVAPIVLRRLDRLMTVERIYRQEGLTIALLAAKLDVPEHRLRQVINEGLGHRNFNAFLNRYRIDEAKASLADVSQRDVPVLTIAMDAGFQSIGPFNRAFKADTGLTPTEFRRDALAQSQASASKTEDASQINQRNREIG